MSHRFKKRERTSNWSPEEKILLLKLCEDRLDILESKRGDQISIAKKGNAWKEIRMEFVAALGIERDVSRLKEQWQRMKCQARSDLQDFAMRLKKYGSEIANQKRPNQLSAEVWRVMESARKYFLHMNGNESDEDAGTKDINWCLSEVTSSSPTESDALPTLLCETEVRTEDNNRDTDKFNFNFPETKEDDKSYPSLMFPYHGLLMADTPSPGGEQAKLDYYTKRNYVLAALTNSQQRTSSEPEESEDDITLSMVLEAKKQEQSKRLQLIDEQMKTAKLNRETAEIQKQIAQQQLKQALLKFNNKKPYLDEEYNEENRKKLKEDIKEKLNFHEEQIQYHQEAINRHKKRLLDFS